MNKNNNFFKYIYIFYLVIFILGIIIFVIKSIITGTTYKKILNQMEFLTDEIGPIEKITIIPLNNYMLVKTERGNKFKLKIEWKRQEKHICVRINEEIMCDELQEFSLDDYKYENENYHFNNPLPKIDITNQYDAKIYALRIWKNIYNDTINNYEYKSIEIFYDKENDTWYCKIISKDNILYNIMINVGNNKDLVYWIG